jgi:RimJ/RimL family protein N-acetyltransferase
MSGSAGRFLVPETLETERLVLRRFTADDHTAYAAMYADPEVMRFIGAGGPLPADAAWRAIASVLGHWELRGYGLWAVTLRDGGELVGHAGFLDPMGWPGFELGYLFARAHWGRGLALEATQAALKVAREVLKRERVISLIRPLNAPSIRLAERLGARAESDIDFLGGPARVFVHSGE